MAADVLYRSKHAKVTGWLAVLFAVVTVAGAVTMPVAGSFSNEPTDVFGTLSAVGLVAAMLGAIGFSAALGEWIFKGVTVTAQELRVGRSRVPSASLRAPVQVHRDWTGVLPDDENIRTLGRKRWTSEPRLRWLTVGQVGVTVANEDGLRLVVASADPERLQAALLRLVRPPS